MTYSAQVENLQPQCIRSTNPKFTYRRTLLTILLWNKTDLDWRQIHYIKERLRSISLHTSILPAIVTIELYFPYPWYSEFGKSCFGFTFKIHTKSFSIQCDIANRASFFHKQNWPGPKYKKYEASAWRFYPFVTTRTMHCCHFISLSFP